jgi:hypothetical protein
MISSAEPRRPLWRRILGREFDVLPPAVRDMFDHNGHRYARGTAQVECGDSWIARMCVTLSGFPRPGRDIPVSILFQADGAADIWHRTFGKRSFSSAHLGENGVLIERFGALTFVFRLTGTPNGVVFDMIETRFFGIALPRPISPIVAATQTDDGGRFRFDITVDLPIVGRMAHMVGLLGNAWPSRLAAPTTATAVAPSARMSRAEFFELT